jgi:hypothetical protein
MKRTVESERMTAVGSLRTLEELRRAKSKEGPVGKLGLGEIKNAKVLEIGLKLRRWKTFPKPKIN